MTDGGETFLTADELVTRWRDRVSKKTLSNWRSMTPRRGPAFTKPGGQPLYALSDVLAWEQQHQDKEPV